MMQVAIVSGGTVVDVIVVPDGSKIGKSGALVLPDKGQMPPPDGASFLIDQAAQRGWQVSGGGVVTPPAAAAVDDDVIVAAAVAEIDRMGDAVYSASPSRVARYERKFAEAKAYKAAGYPASVSQDDYPTLVQEASARGITKRQLADLIIERATEFARLAGFIEARRAGISDAVASAPTQDAKRAAVATVLQAIEAEIAAIS